MQIRLRCNCGEGNCSEWAIVELQGVVEAQPSFQDRLQNLEIGTLCRPSSQEVYSFTVGYHELTGSKVPLKKPILVVKKIRYEDADNTSKSNCNVELQVIGIIRHRILFKTRPKALISKPQVAARERQRPIILGSLPSKQSA
ncbi:chromosome transmission fidelity protein 8-like protein [Senna tora]|uniref:Chromosome transmission fidelity protein 8-like protein n=1 Tax=Senna tora TaxID=362788 RepID=A0A834WLE1_9FABA|nr:chromosome transmission fidelity protein 8-like protein [Senna tora]